MNHILADGVLSYTHYQMILPERLEMQVPESPVALYSSIQKNCNFLIRPFSIDSFFVRFWEFDRLTVASRCFTPSLSLSSQPRV